MRADGYAIRTDRTLGPESRAFARIDRAGDIVDPAAFLVVVDDPAQAETLVYGHVQHCFHIGIRVTVIDCPGAHADTAERAAEVRLVGDQADVTGLRAGAEQCALGARQHFDALQVRGVDVEVPSRLRQRLVVEVEGNVGGKAGHAGGGQVGRRRGDATNINRVLPRAAAPCRDRWQLNDVVGEVRDAKLRDIVAAQGADRDRHVLE